MTPRELAADLRSRINPVYSAQPGTESYERRLCAEAIEAQADEIERLKAELLSANEHVKKWQALNEANEKLAAKAVGKNMPTFLTPNESQVELMRTALNEIVRVSSENDEWREYCSTEYFVSIVREVNELASEGLK